MYITYKIIRFSPNFVGIRMFTSGMTSKLPNDLKCELLMAVFRYLFVIQGCPHSIIIFWEKDRNTRDSAFSTKVEKTKYDAILFLRTPRFPHSDFSTERKTRSMTQYFFLGLLVFHTPTFPLSGKQGVCMSWDSALRTPHSALRTPHSALRTPHSALRTPHSALRTPHSPLRTPHSPLPTPHSPLLLFH